MEVPDYYKDVSVRLMRVLDTVGLREDARWKKINMCLQCEELLEMVVKESFHIFGSQAEATNMSNADFDCNVCIKEVTVLPDLQYWRYGRKTYLMIMDDTTPPGYVKLQAVSRYQAIPIYHVQNRSLKLDRNGRSVLYNTMPFFKQDTADEYHGPASTILGFDRSIDFVVALRGLSWPNTASEWITRQRKHNWPSQETVSVIQKSGALLVPVGHKESDEKNLEWRISLSYGEKILVWQFNHTQYKCYVLLKIIKKYFIEPEFGENALSSYHCKTCMFWLIETTPAALWQPQNVLICIDLCLGMLCTWVEAGYFPNYFIQTENMFIGIVHGRIQRNLANSLTDLFREKGRYLTRIPYCGLGQKLNRACQSPIQPIDDENEYIDFTLQSLVTVSCKALLITWFQLLRQCIQENPRILQGRYPSHGVRQEINTILRNFCCSSLGSHIASKCLKQEVIDHEGLDLAHEFLQLGSSSDVASGKLKLATFHLLQNNVVLAKYILQDIEANYTSLVSNVQTEEYKYRVMLGILNGNLSTTELVRYYSAFPVPYLPSEIHCTPKALIPEMFRSTGSYDCSLNPLLDFWQTWVVVDPKVYLHFLKHQCYHRQNKIPQKMDVLYNMVCVIQHERLKYIDTALNLLAYCLRKDGFLVESYIVLSMSMKLKNHHNAAKWQIAYLINTAFRLVGYRH